MARTYPVYPQVALVALNPHTGQVLALVGGRNYGDSQLNHAVAQRPTGSIFKPFVYAAAFNTAVQGTMLPGQNQLFSPVTILSDQQTTYDVGNGQEYTPRNYARRVSRPGDGALRADTFAEQRHHRPGRAWSALIRLPRWRAMRASRTRAEHRRWPSARMMLRRWIWPGPTQSSPTAECTSIRGCWPACALPTGDVITDYTPTSQQVLDPRVAYLTPT